MANRKKKFSVFIILLFSVACMCAGYGYYEARNIRLKQVNFSNSDLPESFVGKKIVFISDIHSNKYFTGRDVAKLVDKVNERKPDIIVIGGDNVENDSIYTVPFFAEMAKLKSIYGVYSVLGNHDYWENRELIQQGLIDAGINVCDNRSYWIREGNDSIKIGGVSDFWEDEQLLYNTIDGVSTSDFCILLSHNPDYMEVMNTDKVDLMLSGHTHAGQITLFGYWTPVMPSSMHPEFLQTGQKYRYGWVEKGYTHLYVTSGIGVGSFPFRFFAQPEIVEITLTK